MDFFTFDKAYVERLREGDPSTEEHFVGYFEQLLRIKLRSRMLTPTKWRTYGRRRSFESSPWYGRMAYASQNASEPSLTPYVTTFYWSIAERGSSVFAGELKHRGAQAYGRGHGLPHLSGFQQS